MADVTKYVNLNCPIPLAEEVDRIIKDPKLGYRSRNEFCMEAIRIRVQNFKDNGDG